MTGTSLAEITPDRWTMLQRMARAFAESDMVPDQMKGNVGNCTVALLMAEQLHENPVIIVQSIFFVKGRPGWAASYMIARANQSGKFRGPLRWRTEGTGDDLAVTCYARLKDAPEDDDLVEVTVSMAMARADGWTRNEKYKSMPENMLTHRSATWLIRRYCPEVLMGYPVSDELEDTMKDVTPPKFALDDFKPGGRKPPSVIAAEPHSGQGPSGAAYNLVDADGVKHSYDDPESAFEAMRAILRTGRYARGLAGIEAAWSDNQPSLNSALEAAGRSSLADELDDYHQDICRDFAPPAQSPASEPPAQERQQEPEPALPLSAPRAAARKPADWSRWRQLFDRYMRECGSKPELTELIAINFDNIADYNRALPRAAGIFSDERNRRMEELPE